MKKALILIIIISLLTACNEKPFYLENEYYGSNNFTELNESNFNKLVKNKKSFAIFLHQPLCNTSVNFEKNLIKYMKDKQISFYKMTFTEMRKTSLKDKIKYYPSFVIYHEGKLVSYLDASSDKDLKVYKSVKAFDKWFSSYVLKK